MAGLLYVGTHGPDDPTKACIPFHLAVNGAAEAGIDTEINLVGDASAWARPVPPAISLFPGETVYVQVVEVGGLPPSRPDVVPQLVGQALDVVGQVPAQFDDGRPEPRHCLDPGRLEPRLDEPGKAVRRDLLEPHYRAGLVEGTAAAEHPLHQGGL